MEKKFSPQSREAFLNAARTFNSMRTKAINQGIAIEDTPPKIKTADVFKELGTTEQLRQLTKTLEDYKHIGDFAQSEAVEYPATVGEVRTARRSFRSEKAKLRAENLKINEALSKPTTPVASKQKLIEKQATIEAKTVYIEKRQKDLKSFRGREEFKRAVESSKREALSFDYEGWDRYRKNYMKRIYELGDETGTDVTTLIMKMGGMTLQKFKEWTHYGKDDAEEHERLLRERYALGDNLTTLATLADDLGVNSDAFDFLDSAGLDL